MEDSFAVLYSMSRQRNTLSIPIDQRYLSLTKVFSDAIPKLHARDSTVALATRLFPPELSISIGGSPCDQIRFMEAIVNKSDRDRWLGLVNLRMEILKYKEAELEEQPVKKVYNMIEDARRRKGQVGNLEFDTSGLHVRGLLQALSLMLLVDEALLADFLSLKDKVRFGSNQRELRIDLTANRNESKQLIGIAASTHHVFQQVEGNIYLAQLCALEISRETTFSAEALRQEANEAVEEAERLCSLFPGQTRGLESAVQAARNMLQGTTFYAPATDEERMEILQAMAYASSTSFIWYYCANGHPFTIGDCGRPVEVSTCPECGAAVGGQDHVNVTGVTRADDLEEMLQQAEQGLS